MTDFITVIVVDARVASNGILLKQLASLGKKEIRQI
jgi:hypothetical protein